MRCDVIAEGIVEAAKTLDLRIPLVVRLQGKASQTIVADNFQGSLLSSSRFLCIRTTFHLSVKREWPLIIYALLFLLETS